MLIACKYEEIWPPLVDDFIYMCDGAFCKQDILSMEVDVLRTLDFSICVVSAYSFLQRIA
jgi:hypothetical protein